MANNTTDILFDDQMGDLACVNGDFVISDATCQHQKDLLVASEGEYKFDPVVGVGLYEFLDDEDSGDMMRKVRIQFGKDGMNVKSAKINNAGIIEIDAPYI